MTTDDYARDGIDRFLAGCFAEWGTLRAAPSTPTAEQLERERVEIEIQFSKSQVCPWGIGDPNVDPYA